MINTPHNHDESAGAGAGGSSRPDDPVVVAHAAGKTTREPGSEKQRHDDNGEPVERRARDVLLGATVIAEHLTAILGVPVDAADVYYAHRMKKLPIGKYGALLIASKRRLARHADELTRGPAAPDPIPPASPPPG